MMGYDFMSMIAELPDLPELMGELDAAEKNAAELRHILAQGLVAVQERVLAC